MIGGFPRASEKPGPPEAMFRWTGLCGKLCASWEERCPAAAAAEAAAAATKHVCR